MTAHCEIIAKETDELMKSVAADMREEDKPIKELLNESTAQFDGRPVNTTD